MDHDDDDCEDNYCHLYWVLGVLENPLLHLVGEFLEVGGGGDAQCPVDDGDGILLMMTDLPSSSCKEDGEMSSWRSTFPAPKWLPWDTPPIRRKREW